MKTRQTIPFMSCAICYASDLNSLSNIFENIGDKMRAFSLPHIISSKWKANINSRKQQSLVSVSKLRVIGSPARVSYRISAVELPQSACIYLYYTSLSRFASWFIYLAMLPFSYVKLAFKK